jgi:hypothetical protein
LPYIIFIHICNVFYSVIFSFLHPHQNFLQKA